MHQRRAVLGAPRAELGGREPLQRDDFLVERSRFLADDAATEAKAQEGDVLRGVVPAVDADQARRLEAVRGLLEHLAPARLDQRLAGVEVAGRLVEHQPSVYLLLNEQKPAAALHHRGDRDARPPHVPHAAFLVFLRMKSAMRATPCSMACFEAAYEKRTCCPSPGTRVPKWMSASTATPASLSRRFLNSSESAAPMRRQASLTFGQT